jgi:hypothetical protein
MGPANTTIYPNVMQKHLLQKKKETEKDRGLIWHHGLILPLN